MNNEIEKGINAIASALEACVEQAKQQNEALKIILKKLDVMGDDIDNIRHKRDE